MIDLTKEEKDFLVDLLNNVPLNGTYVQLQALVPLVTSVLTKLGDTQDDNSK